MVVMASDADSPTIFRSPTPKLSRLSIPRLLQSPQRSGTLTPPLLANVSVPFRWEQEPGKPIPSTALTILPSPTCLELELPPRLLFKLTKLPSPTPPMPKPKFRSSSFRMAASPDRGQLGAMILSNRYQKQKGWFGSLRRKKLSLKGVFPSSVDRESDGSCSTSSVKMTRVKKAGSFSSLAPARSQFWATFYQNLKQGMSWNWKSKKMEKPSL